MEVGSRGDVTVVVDHCPRPGVYLPDEATIVIDRHQTRAMRRSALAHELGHHELGHRPTSAPQVAARQELRASRWAVVRLIGLADLAEAMVAAGSWWEVAESLDVDPELLEIRVQALTDEERRKLLGMVGRRELNL